MKKTLTITLAIMCLMACKNEPEAKREINTNSINTVSVPVTDVYKADINRALLQDLDRITFKDKVLPSINKLYNSDNKYKMLHLIAEKLSKESNNEAFKLGLENFKNEYKKLNN